MLLECKRRLKDMPALDASVLLPFARRGLRMYVCMYVHMLDIHDQVQVQ